MAGKGDKRRPRDISQEEWEMNWDQAFSKKKKKRLCFKKPGKWYFVINGFPISLSDEDYKDIEDFSDINEGL